MTDKKPVAFVTKHPSRSPESERAPKPDLFVEFRHLWKPLAVPVLMTKAMARMIRYRWDASVEATLYKQRAERAEQALRESFAFIQHQPGCEVRLRARCTCGLDGYLWDVEAALREAQGGR